MSLIICVCIFLKFFSLLLDFVQIQLGLQTFFQLGFGNIDGHRHVRLQPIGPGKNRQGGTQRFHCERRVDHSGRVVYEFENVAYARRPRV